MPSKFYFCATNSCGRISPGDIVLIDPGSEITPDSIVLTADLTLHNIDPSHTLIHLGKVINLYIPR